jgi:hypothetical protein
MSGVPDKLKDRDYSHEDVLTYLQMRDYVDAILEERLPAVNVYDAAKTSMAAMAAANSVRIGRSVRIPRVPDRSEEWPSSRDYQRENRAKRLDDIKMLDDLNIMNWL